MRAPYQGRRVVICLGTGGVGKTTVAAAMALAAARGGKRTLVMTIDPARRLAQALGLGDIGHAKQRVPDERLGGGAGSLDVQMPDVRGTFDALVQRFAPSPQAAEALLGNRIYQHFASALAGSHEYAAVEALYDAHSSGQYDLIVVDTPPAQNAVAFLNAPRRVLDFLGTDAVRWLLRPSGFTGKLLGWGGQMILRGVGKVAGDATLVALREFVQAFDGMAAGFVERADLIQKLFADPALAFVLVTSPDLAQLRLAPRTLAALEALHLRLGALICNRLRPRVDWPQPAARAVWQAALGELPAAEAEALRQGLAAEIAAGEDDRQTLQALERVMGQQALALPEAELEELVQALG